MQWPGVPDGSTLTDGEKTKKLAGTGGGEGFPGFVEQPAIKKPEPGPSSSKETGKVTNGKPSDSW